MKLLYFDDFKLGVLKNDAVVDVSAAVKDIPHTGPGDLMNGLIEHWGSYKPRLEAAAARGTGVPVSSVRIRPPVPGPRTIDCMAVNYMEDGTRSAPAPINAFHKSPSAIIGHGDTMVLPDVPATIFEGEAEIAVVIGKKCSHVSELDAMSYVFGYMNFIDGSARGLPPPGNVFFQMKSRDTFAPIGPYLVTSDEIKDPLKLQIRLWNNGVLMQNFNTDDMGHKIGKCIAWLSTIHTLLPRRHRRHRHQSPGSQSIHGRRYDRAGNRRARPVEVRRQGRSQAQLGAQDPPPDARRGQGEDPGRLPGLHPAAYGQVREVTAASVLAPLFIMLQLSIAPFPIDDIPQRPALEIGAQIVAEEIDGAMTVLITGRRYVRRDQYPGIGPEL